MKLKKSIITGDRVDSHNTFDQPENIRMNDFKNTKCKNGQLTLKLPAKSLVVVEIN